jgi:glycosyltransferase involved in cell wall biosynthesis
MVEDPAVTVIIATRNRSAYLDVALSSLVTQDYEAPFEILIVDNGSTDDTRALLDGWCRTDERIRVVCEPEPGLSNAKNAGVAAAEGRVLVFTDDDVVLDRRWLATLVSALESHPSDLVVVGGKIVPVPHDLGAWPPWFDDAALPDAGLLDLAAGEPVAAPQYVWGASMAVRSELFRRVGPWDHAVGRRGDERGTFEDTELQDRVRSAGGTIWFCRDAVLQHRVARSTLTRRELVLRAFARGGYDRRIEKLRLVESSERLSPALIGLVALSVARLVVWELAFGVLGGRRVFRKLHNAAWRTGWLLERVESHVRDHPDHAAQPVAQALRRVVWVSRRLIQDTV